ncbi:MAG: prepilin-type N-terminal cleavage/methylation domain-containing protein [Burkholderiales bacterium]|jgi:general secretion pathway protein J|nr:prepilin-type N-terminal cleavage/methylation domain-containing protein [Burkholderiales bacterium]
MMTPMIHFRPNAGIPSPRRAFDQHSSGFTLLEVMIAMTLLALLSGTLLGIFKMAGKTRDLGESLTDAATMMRSSQTFLRAQLENAYPLRFKKVPGHPLIFFGQKEELIYVSAMPARHHEGGLYAWRLSTRRDADRLSLILSYTTVDANHDQLPDFKDARQTVLAEEVSSLELNYFGLPEDASIHDDPVWTHEWKNTQRLPQMIRMEVSANHHAAWQTFYVILKRAPEVGCPQWNESSGVCGGGA